MIKINLEALSQGGPDGSGTKNKGPKKISRRKFLEGAALTAGSALLAACRVPETPSPPITTPATKPAKATATKTAVKPATAIKVPEATKIPEITRVPEVIPPTLDDKFFTDGLSGIGGGGRIKLPTVTLEGEVVTVGDLFDYNDHVWGEQIEPERIGQDGVEGLRFSLSAVERSGIEDSIVNLGQAFPRLPLRVGRVTINNLDDVGIDAVLEADPNGLKIRKGAHVTLVGVTRDEAVVGVDDFGRTPDGSPRLFLGVAKINSDGRLGRRPISELLNRNGAQLDKETLTWKDGSKLRLHPVDSDFLKDIKREAGALFVDTIGVDNIGFPILHSNPVVPFPSEKIVGTEYGGVVQINNGTVVALDVGRKNPIAQANYNEKKSQWEWSKYKERLGLQPAELSRKAAVKLIAGGEFVDLSGFQGRVLKETKTGATLVLTKGAVRKIDPKLLEKPDNIRLAEAVNNGPWVEALLPHITEGAKIDIGEDDVLLLDERDRVIRWGDPLESLLSSGSVAKKNIFRGTNPDFQPEVAFDDEHGFVLTDHLRITHKVSDVDFREAMELDEYIPLGTPEQRTRKILGDLVKKENPLDLDPYEVLRYQQTGVDTGLKTFRVLRDSESRPAIVLVTGGEHGLNYSSGLIGVVEAAVGRLNEVDPNSNGKPGIARRIVDQLGVKVIGGDITGSLFTNGREGYLASFEAKIGAVGILGQSGGVREPSMMGVLVAESNGVFDSRHLVGTSVGFKLEMKDMLDPNIGVDKELKTKRWASQHAARLTKIDPVLDATELQIINRECDASIDFYRKSS